MVRFIICLLLAMRFASAVDKLPDAPPFRFSYYLFEVSPSADGCSACYIPLLVTREPLEKPARQAVAVIETYERDSIWQLKPALVPVSLAEGHDSAARQLLFEGKTYRYQLVSNGEALRLLRNPEGSIPIHRLAFPILLESSALKDVLLRDLAAAVAMP